MKVYQFTPCSKIFCLEYFTTWCIQGISISRILNRLESVKLYYLHHLGKHAYDGNRGILLCPQEKCAFYF